MSQRPRLAGDGRLNLPEKVVFDHHGFIQGRYGERTVDPFDWTEDRLLLAESFARLDLSDRQAVKDWWVHHGAVNLLDFGYGDADLPDEHDDWHEHRKPNDLIESREENAKEQANVEWHLATLVRLSEHREARTWDPAWGHVVLKGPHEVVVGGPHAGTVLWPWHRFDLVERIEAARDAYGDPEPQRALAAEVGDWPRLTVQAEAWYGYWEPDVPSLEDAKLLPGIESIGSTWASMLELERLLMEPYVRHAVERRFHIDIEPAPDDGHPTLVPREERTWISILAPIYLQLFEALRRISEDDPGAAICRECGQPFLMLDARRRYFCNKREGFRHAKREQRKRLAVTSSRPFDLGSGEVKEGDES